LKTEVGSKAMEVRRRQQPTIAEAVLGEILSKTAMEDCEQCSVLL
jgi:hypothetical protein